MVNSVRNSNHAEPSGRAVTDLVLRSLVCWDQGFEPRQGHGYLCVVSVEWAASSVRGWTLDKRIPTGCVCVCGCVSV